MFAIAPVGGLVHYLAFRFWLAIIFSPIVLFSASLSVAQLGSSLTEYELSDTKIKKIVLGRVVGVLRYDAIEKVRFRENRWCYIKGRKQTFFFVPKMNGYEECVEFIGAKMKSTEFSDTIDAKFS
jgi:hypothetical protein